MRRILLAWFTLTFLFGVTSYSHSMDKLKSVFKKERSEEESIISFRKSDVLSGQGLDEKADIIQPVEEESDSVINDISNSNIEQSIDLGHGVKLELVWIPPGEFIMGSPESESGRDSDESPQHSVRIAKGFWVGKYEVTQVQWQQVMGSNPSCFKGNNNPVERVSWNDCQEFLQKMSRITGKSFRLPTEAEWEYTCRAGTTSDLNSGKELTNIDSCPNLDQVAWYVTNSGYKPHPVGKKNPNAWGLYDMHGNVWEWCQDWKGSYASGTQTDPQGPSSGSDRILRGGTWIFYAKNCRSAYRGGLAPGFCTNFIGFRIVMSASQD